MHSIQTAEPEAWYTVAAECMRSEFVRPLTWHTMFLGLWAADSLKLRVKEVRCYGCRVLAITSEAPQSESSWLLSHTSRCGWAPHTHTRKRLWTILHHYSKQKNPKPSSETHPHVGNELKTHSDIITTSCFSPLLWSWGICIPQAIGGRWVRRGGPSFCSAATTEPRLSMFHRKVGPNMAEICCILWVSGDPSDQTPSTRRNQ